MWPPPTPPLLCFASVVLWFHRNLGLVKVFYPHARSESHIQFLPLPLKQTLLDYPLCFYLLLPVCQLQMHWKMKCQTLTSSDADCLSSCLDVLPMPFYLCDQGTQTCKPNVSYKPNVPLYFRGCPIIISLSLLVLVLVFIYFKPRLVISFISFNISKNWKLK